MKIKLHHVNLCTTNVKAMDEFYKCVLDLEPEPTMQGLRTQGGYDGKVSFVHDGKTQFHLAERDLDCAFRNKQSLNPLEKGHIAFRTDDIAAFKKRLEAKGIPYADYGGFAINGWHQVFFQDPDGNVIEVHQAPEGL